MSAEDWTPYGLEAIRVRHLRRRRRAIGAFIAVAAILWLVFAPKPTTGNEVQIFANGNRVGGTNGLSIDAPEKEKPVTVAIQPGKITHASAGSVPSEQVKRDTPKVPSVTIPRAAPVQYAAKAIQFGPLLLVALGLWLLARKKRTGQMVNYGIYKGAMPLELISASASKRVFTTRGAGGSIFGKTRADYLPPEVERVPQEEADA